MNKLLDLLKELWNAPSGKQVIGILLILPVAIVTFFHIYYGEMRRENIELRKDNKELQTLYINEVKEGNRRVFLVDSIHVAKAAKKQEEENLRNEQLIQELRQDLKQAEKRTQEARELNKATIETVAKR